MEIKIEKLDNFGNGICHYNNKIVFVKYKKVITL